MTDKMKYLSNGMEGRPFKTNPRLIRTGVVSDDYSEMTPVIFGGKLLLLATAKPTAEANPYGKQCLWVEDVATHQVIATFGEGCAFGSGFVHDDTFYAFAVPRDPGGTQRIACFWSEDLANWESANALLPDEGEKLYNESVCKAGDRFVMAYESKESKYPPFTIKFAESLDLRTWTKIPEAIYGTDRYTACPTLRYIDGTFYMLYLEWLQPKWWFETYLTRSTDLIHWEQSPRNPVLAPEGVEGINTSDIDLVELGDKVIVYYLYGDQKTWHRAASAEFDGTLEEFFKHYYYET